MMSGRSSKYPFTASQWQELEHQALIFKYIAVGAPIPHDLLHHIKRSFYHDSSSTSAYPNGGWGCFQMGFGRKAEDPEPWRCRRTDGKKWRCSKEAYPDSKYCERHMHRGKNRSRKPEEMPTAHSSTTSSKPSLYPPHLPMAAAAAESHHAMDPYTSRHGGLGFGGAAHFHMDSASSVYRHNPGLKEELDQYIALSDSSGARRERSWQFTPVGVSLPGEHRRSSRSPSLQDGSRLAMGELPREREHEQKEKRQHCFVLGADVEQERPAAMTEGEGEPRRPLLHFFDDWPLRTREPWMAAGEEQLVWGGFPKTQLSMSIPTAHHNFPTAGSRPGGADD